MEFPWKINMERWISNSKINSRKQIPPQDACKYVSESSLKVYNPSWDKQFSSGFFTFLIRCFTTH